MKITPNSYIPQEAAPKVQNQANLYDLDLDIREESMPLKNWGMTPTINGCSNTCGGCTVGCNTYTCSCGC